MLRVLKVGVVNILVFLLLTVLLILCGTLWLTLLYSNPGLASTKYMTRFSKDYYFDRMNVVQWMEECTDYHGKLTYILKGGASCRFTNAEYDTTIRANSKGLRDDEASLKGPEVIVLGDSHAMGWGVEEDETFPSYIEREGKVKVLNGGVSSYSTIREGVLLSTLDTSRLRYLVIQYSANDINENRIFYGTGEVPRFGRSDYEKRRVWHRETRDLGFLYKAGFVSRFLKGTVEVVLSRLSGAEEAGGPVSSDDRRWIGEANYFLNVLNSIGADLSGVHLIVLELNLVNERLEGDFPRYLREVIDEGGLTKRVGKISVLDVEEALSEEDFYPLDGHMKGSGHRVVGELLLREMAL